MISSGKVSFGISAASMTATWIWAASFYGAAIFSYNYGLSEPMHYGFWGALMILFIYTFTRELRRGQTGRKARGVIERTGRRGVLLRRYEPGELVQFRQQHFPAFRG